jgi:serine protease Do
MNIEKDSLANNKNSQGSVSRLLLYLAISFIIINGISLYKGIDGQKINSNISNSSALLNNTNTIENNSITKNDSIQRVNGSSFDYSTSLPDLFNHVEKSVVQITDSADLQQQSNIAGMRLGSGFVYDNKGDIVTNYHVVAGATNNTVTVTFLDGVSYEAKVIGLDPYTELAVVKLINLDKHKDALSKLVPLEIANSTSLRVGDRVVTLGNPFGLSGSLTEGIISGLGRLMPVSVDQFNVPSTPSQSFSNQYNLSVSPSFSIPDVIQTDAAINPGNSGGPLLNMKGQAIGINTAIYSNTGAYAGIGFAIPSNFITKVVPTLINGETYRHPYLGLSGVDVTPQIAKVLNLSKSTGYLVINVTKNSPALLAGVKGGNTTYSVNGIPVKVGGDVIIKIDNNAVRKVNDILSYLENYKKVGDNVSLTVLRDDNKSMVISFPTIARPDINVNINSSSAPNLGILGTNLTPDIAKLMNITQSSGFLVTGVLNQSPASKADIRGGYIISEINGRQIQLGGDIITKINNTTVKNQQDIKNYLSDKKIGDTINITIIRDGKSITKNLLLTDFKPNPSISSSNNNNSPNPNQLPNLPSFNPDQNFNDFLNMCSKILDKQTCNSLIPNQ